MLIYIQFNYLCFTISLHCRPRLRATSERLGAGGGVRYSSCGLQTFNFPLHFPRRYTPACAKPPVARWHFYCFTVIYHFFTPLNNLEVSNFYLQGYILQIIYYFLLLAKSMIVLFVLVHFQKNFFV